MVTFLLLLALAVLIACDAATTIYGVRIGAIETNVLADATFRSMGLVAGVAARSLGYFAMFAGIAVAAPDQWGALVIGCIGFALPVAGNVIGIREMRRGAR